jgi:oligoribonuclease NrnB/cAMP/cGMP phosphodiesterase (DHH superfamily)
MIESNVRPLVIYHANCLDGFTAAWAAREAFNGNVDFVRGMHQTPPAEVDGRDVYLVDFAYPREILEQVRDRARRVVVLDHHKTAEADLAGLDGVELHFDQSRSGARLAWDYWFADRTPPAPLLHVEDRDLWRFSLPGTREVTAALASYPYDFDLWSTLMQTDVEVLVAEGRVLVRKQARDLDGLIRDGVRRLRIGGHDVPALNVPRMYASDAGARLSVGEPFAVTYWDSRFGRSFSLRSQKGGLDVSAIAQPYGGGGHAGAAGFRTSFDVARSFEIEA